MRTITLQKYFSSLKVSHASARKIKDVLASVMGSAVRFRSRGEATRSRDTDSFPRTGKKHQTDHHPGAVRAARGSIAEPYATMVYVCVLAGLRVSELIALKWEDVHTDSITIDERYCRGDWACPKQTPAVPPSESIPE